MATTFYTSRTASPCNTCGETVPANRGIGPYVGQFQGTLRTYCNVPECIPTVHGGKAKWLPESMAATPVGSKTTNGEPWKQVCKWGPVT